MYCTDRKIEEVVHKFVSYNIPTVNVSNLLLLLRDSENDLLLLVPCHITGVFKDDTLLVN